MSRRAGEPRTGQNRPDPARSAADRAPTRTPRPPAGPPGDARRGREPDAPTAAPTAAVRLPGRVPPSDLDVPTVAVRPAARPEPDVASPTTAVRTPLPAAAEPPASPPDALVERTRRIDESLIRLIAAHEGAADPARTEPDSEPGDPDVPPPTDDGADDSADDGAPLTPPLGPRQRILRTAVVMVVALLFAASTLGWSSKLWLEGRIHQVAALDTGSGAIVDADAQAGARNVLLLGLDHGEGGSFVPGAGAGTIVVAHLPAGGGPVTRVSFPRNLEINRPPCQRWDPAAAGYLPQTVPAETRTTLDTAFQVGGPGCAVRVLQQLTGLSITGFAAVDLAGLTGMTDALGGVPICLDRPLVDGVLGPVTTASGPTTVRGAEVTGIVRATHVQGDPGTDEALVERQNRVLAAVLDRALSTSVLLDPWEVRAFGRIFGEGTLADGVDAGQLLSVASALSGTGAEPGRFVPVPTAAGTNSRGNTELRDRDAAAMFKALRTDAAIPAEATAAQAASTAPAPSAVTVDVLNASDRAGLAGQVGDALRAAGFGVGQVANAPQHAADTVIRFSPDRSAEAQVVAAAVPSARPVPDSTASGVLQLLIGNSFDGTVRAVAATATGPVATPPTDTRCG